jgi:hypothetical protein
MVENVLELYTLSQAAIIERKGLRNENKIVFE